MREAPQGRFLSRASLHCEDHLLTTKRIEACGPAGADSLLTSFEALVPAAFATSKQTLIRKPVLITHGATDAVVTPAVVGSTCDSQFAC